MEELKQCPFCGGDAKLHSSIAGLYVKCRNCKVENYCFDTSGQAIEAWNTRANGWISVDTPPISEKEVIINGLAKTGRWNGEIWQSQYGREDPTHWQLLPKKP